MSARMIFRLANGQTSTPETSDIPQKVSPNTRSMFVALPSVVSESLSTRTIGRRTARPGISLKTRIAREKDAAAYIRLQCEHYTSIEDQNRIPLPRGMKPPKGKLWCDLCGKWRCKAPRATEPPLPDDPRMLF